MNFFEHQARARRRTTLLVGYFVLAVVAIIVSVSAALYLALFWASGQTYTLGQWLQSGFFYASIGVTLALILFGSLRKLWQLRDGGPALADMLGAREISPDTRGGQERIFRNVVEEMAIASGIPAPRTYVLEEEPLINAFVAGFRPTEAIVVITGGCLEHLSRDELQGVIAHEFSHIFNADMRLNMRLLAILSGILTIGRVGEFMLRGLGRRHHHRSSLVRMGRSRNDVRSHPAILLVGVAMMVIGYLGLFFGRLIKSAISRQREFLADASSVQFTRNPTGIAGALIKIRNGGGAIMLNAHAEDMSHMCFGQAVDYRLQGLLATHPPVDERLRAIGPEWVARARARARDGADAGTQATAPAPEGSSSFAGNTPATPAAPIAPATLSETVGTVGPAHMGYAVSLLSAIPSSLRTRLQQPALARQAILAMVIADQKQPAEVLAGLDLNNDDSAQLAPLADQIRALGTRVRLPLIDLALPALKQLDQPQRDAFLEQLHALISADKKLSLFEYALSRMLDDHLSRHAERNRRVRFRRYGQLENDIQLVFSLLAHVSGSDDEAAREAFSRHTAVLLPPARTLLPVRHCKMARLDQALENLRDLTPILKGPLVDAMADMVLSDNKVQVAEAELLRAICTLLDCPVPPLQGAA